jgi:exosome complex exonuclease DIS3/RRP44
MAQMAGRASVEFYVGLALKGRNEREKGKGKVIEEAFVIRTFRNGLGVFVSKLVLHHSFRGTLLTGHLGLELRGW